MMTECSHHLEIEVKFHLSDAALIKRRLLDAGAVPGPKRFETNLCFENQGHQLARNDQLLRLRQDNTCRLTFKQKPIRNDTECKVYRELEVEVSDHDTTAAILNALGYHGVQRYEKWRQTFTWENVELCIDNMPYGDFLEIEGAAQDIQGAAQKLCLSWDKRILANYLAIFELLRQACALPFDDLTFDNFRRHSVDIRPHLPALQTRKTG